MSVEATKERIELAVRGKLTNYVTRQRQGYLDKCWTHREIGTRGKYFVVVCRVCEEVIISVCLPLTG